MRCSGPNRSGARSHGYSSLGVPDTASIVDLARGADQHFIEAAFLDADGAVSEATRYLTTRAADEIARAAGARRITPFHHSARYGEDVSALEKEVNAAFDAD